MYVEEKGKKKEERNKEEKGKKRKEKGLSLIKGRVNGAQ